MTLGHRDDNTRSSRQMNRLKITFYLKLYFFVAAIITMAMANQLANEMRAFGIPLSLDSLRWQFILLFAILGIILSLMFILQFTSLEEFFSQILHKVFYTVSQLRWIGIVLFIASIGILLLIVLFPIRSISLVFPRLWFYLLAFLGISISLKLLIPNRDILFINLVSILTVSVIFKVFTYIPDINSYPFSLSWSEASRYYYASLLFSKKVWGQNLPLSPLHPSRYILQSFPYLVTQSPLWLHRLWQVLLWIFMPALSGITFARRFSNHLQIKFWMMAGWTSLFLIQGPVYYHLHICLIVIFLFFDTERKTISILAVVFASIWAGISRVNWFPVPAFMAVAIYLIEYPVSKIGNTIKYLYYPVIIVFTGIIAAFLSQAAYIGLSGNVVSKFASSFTSDLLWYRLLPNATYKPGILLGIIGISFPLIFVVVFHMKNNWSAWHPIRMLGLGSILFVLFGGGLVVSVKIGGGSNLHNMDAFMVLLLIIGVYLFFGKFSPETNTAETTRFPNAQILAIGVFIPAFFAFQTGIAAIKYDPIRSADEFSKLQRTVDDVVQSGGNVLFISQRHLLTMKLLNDVPLIRDYENIELMEMAMAGNQVYLNSFLTDIAQHKFELIITDPLFTVSKERNHAFSEENNAWTERISKPILDEYQELLNLEYSHVQILEPKP